MAAALRLLGGGLFGLLGLVVGVGGLSASVSSVFLSRLLCFLRGDGW